MALFKLPRPRDFNIETFYYKPEDEDYDPKRRIRFRRIRHYDRGEKTNPVRLLLVVLVLLFLVFYLQKKAGLVGPGEKSDTFQVEEIIIVD